MMPGWPPPAQVQEAPRLVLQRLRDLDFGALLAGVDAGSLSLDADGHRTWQGGTRPGSGPAEPAAFRVTGPPGLPFQVRVAPETLRGAGAGLTVTAWHLRQEGVFNAAGEARIQLGATLAIPARADSGAFQAGPALLSVEAPGCRPATVAFLIRGRALQAIRVQETAAMSFGTLVSGALDQEVRLDPDGALDRRQVGERSRAGQFLVQGEPGAVVAVTLPDSAQLAGPGPALRLREFRCDAAGNSLVLKHGRAQVAIGATLSLPRGQAPGRYQGVYAVVFAYN